MSSNNRQFGGIINESDVLKHILSIGYEFETHDLAKLSLYEDKYLINSASKNDDIEKELKFDKNYYTYQATLDLDKDTNSSFVESSESKQSIHTAPTIHSGEIDAEYIEYMLEPRPKDNKYTKVAITNDISNSGFVKMLNKRCGGREKDKNALYAFQTIDGKVYDIKFDSTMRKTSCGGFSGLEIIITYYKPTVGKNIIVETMADACERVVDHLSELKEVRGDLFMANKKKNGFTAIGKIPYRKLYNKEGTNLYYLETYDTAYVNTRSIMSKFAFKPQMTFCTNIEHVYDVIMYLTHIPKMRASALSESLDVITSANILYEELIDSCVNYLIDDFNKNNEKNAKTRNYTIDMKTTFGMIMRNYLFLMYVKIDAYITNFNKQTREEMANINASKVYFKNHLYMLVRHSNYDLYTRMKYHMKKQFGTSNKVTIQLLKQLLYNEEHLSKYVYNEYPNIFGRKLNKSDADFGDPKASLESYFDFFENPKEKENRDWLIHSEVDIESTMYPLKNDNIIIEARVFSGNAIHYYMKTLNKRMRPSSDAFTLKQMADIVAEVKNKTPQNIVMGLDNKELNPTTGRMVIKCAQGKVRNDNFRCVKNTNKTMRRPVKIGKAAKDSPNARGKVSDTRRVNS